MVYERTQSRCVYANTRDSIRHNAIERCASRRSAFRVSSALLSREIISRCVKRLSWSIEKNKQWEGRSLGRTSSNSRVDLAIANHGYFHPRFLDWKQFIRLSITLRKSVKESVDNGTVIHLRQSIPRVRKPIVGFIIPQGVICDASLLRLYPVAKLGHVTQVRFIHVLHNAALNLGCIHRKPICNPRYYKLDVIQGVRLGIIAKNFTSVSKSTNLSN